MGGTPLERSLWHRGKEEGVAPWGVSPPLPHAQSQANPLAMPFSPLQAG